MTNYTSDAPMSDTAALIDAVPLDVTTALAVVQVAIALFGALLTAQGVGA